MDLVFLSVLIGVALAVVARVVFNRQAVERLLAMVATGVVAGLLVTWLSGFSPFYFVSPYLMMAIFGFLGGVLAHWYTPVAYSPPRPGSYSLKVMLGVVLGLVVYAGYWLYTTKTGLIDEIPISKTQHALAFVAIGILVFLGFTASAGIIRTYWPPIIVQQDRSDV